MQIDRAVVVRAGAALWGVAAAVASMPGLQRPAGTGDLPGAMHRIGLDPSGPPLQFALLAVLPFLAALAVGPAAERLAPSRWASWSVAIALGSAVMTLMHFGTLRHVILHLLAAAGIFLARRLEPRFSRADALLVPTLLSFYIAFLDTGFGKTPAATFFRAAAAVFALRLLVGWLSPLRRPGVAFSLAPLAFLAQMQTFEPAWAGAIAIVWMAGSAGALAGWHGGALAAARFRLFAVWIAFPLAAAAYPLALIGVTSPPALDFFEDGHSLLPASEMARGEKPYRDIVPMHGLVSDGLLDLVSMTTAGEDLGSILTVRRVAGALTMAAIYFTALAVTSSGELALLAAFLSVALFPAATIWPRALPALLALACLAAGTRLRARKWFAVAGALLVVALLFSVDLAIYTLPAAAIAAIRSRAVRPLLAGLAIAAVPLLAAFAALGILLPFLRATFVEVLGTRGIYTIAPLEVPDGLQNLAALAGRMAEPSTLAMVIWLAALAGAAAALAASPLRARRSDAVWVVALWIVGAGAAWVLRRQTYFIFAAAPFVIGSILLVRRRSRGAALALLLLVAFLSRPFSHVFDVLSPLRRTGGARMTEWTELREIPRARGARIHPATHRGLLQVRRFLQSSLAPRETFFDFANAGTLYFLFERDAPVRYLEVPAYESEAAQREVIAVLQRDRRIRAALIGFPSAGALVDGIPNRERAPLVWKYLQENFRPAFSRDGVEFRVRR